MTTTLARPKIIEVNTTPADRMRELGVQHNALMSQRIKANQAGYTAIHRALCDMTDANEKEQHALLLANPDLLAL